MPAPGRVRFVIRPALPRDAADATRVAVAAKRAWGYDNTQLTRWVDGLTVTHAQLTGGCAFVAEERSDQHAAVLVGVAVALPVLRGGTAVLEHLWVVPPRMRLGIGRALLVAVRERLAAGGAHRLRIEADPHAEAFYLKCDARRIGVMPAPIAGQPTRVLPVLEIEIGQPDF